MKSSTTLKELIDSLKLQSECPKCGADWDLLEDLLYEGMGSPNFQEAQIIMGNCPVCQMRFRKEVRYGRERTNNCIS